MLCVWFAPNRALKQIQEYSCRLNLDEDNPRKKVEDFIKFLPVLCYDGSTMKEVNAEEIIDIAMSGTSATLLARRWESAVLVNVDNATLERLMANEDAMRALMSIEGFRSLNQDIESKNNILKGYSSKLKQLDKKTKNISGLGSNILTTATVYEELNKKTPENVRFVSLKVSNKDQITIAGVAKDDQSVIEMMNNLTILSSVKESKIDTLIELSEDDRIALYTTEGETAPKLEDLPKETIAKKFTISLKLNPVEGEKFDDEKNYAELVKRTKK